MAVFTSLDARSLACPLLKDMTYAEKYVPSISDDCHPFSPPSQATEHTASYQ